MTRIRLFGAAPIAAAIAVASTSWGDVVVSQWSANAWEFKRIQVPDLDQRRDGLPNDGKCFCVPTSLLSTLTYCANHGFPGVGAGPFNGLDPATYPFVTAVLDEYGAIAGTSPGGVDPSSGENIPCGTGYAGGKDIATAALAGVDGLIHIQVTPSPTWAPTDAYLAQMSNAPAHPIGSVGYTRYEIVGYTPEGWPKVIGGGGGHRVTLTGLHLDPGAGERWIRVRDPDDENNLATQSAYAHRQIGVMLREVAPVPDPAHPEIYWHRTMSLLDDSLDDNKTAAIASVQWFWPATGHSFTENGIFQSFPLKGGFGPIIDPSPIPMPGGEIGIDIVPQMDNIDLFVLTRGTPTASPGHVWVSSFGSTERILLATIANSSQLASTRMRSLLVLAGPDVFQLEPDQPDLPPVPHPLPYDGSAIAYDDASDACIVLSTTGRAILRFLPYATGGGVEETPLPRSWPLGDAARIDVCPTDHSFWFLTDASDKLFGVVPGAAGGPGFVAYDLPGVVDPTSVAFDDHGRMVLVAAGGVKVFERTATGGWTPGDASDFVGKPIGHLLRLARSRSNIGGPLEFDDAEEIPPAEYEPLGLAIPDCPGDFDLSGTIDAGDLARLLGAWGTCPGCEGDIDGDGAVSGSDLAMLLGSWGACSG